MERVLKKRLVGTAVIVALAVIFVPMLLEGPGKETREVSMQISIPDRPAYDIPNRLAKNEPVSEPVPLVSADSTTVAPVMASQAETVEAKTESAAASVVASIPVVGEQPAAAPVAQVKPVVVEEKEQVVQVLAAAKPQMSEEPKPSAANQIKTETSSAGFVIQVGSFSSSANADALKNRLVSAGYPAFVDASKVKNNDIYRVKVGPKPSRKQANELRIELIDEEKLEGIIVRHP